MAKDSSQEKTENATPKRLREAKKKGDVAKSKDLTTVFVLVVVFVTIAFTANHIADTLKEFMRHCYTLVEKGDLTLHDVGSVLQTMVWAWVKAVGPVLIAGFVAALFIGLIQVGGVFSTDPLKPKIEKLNPIEGFKNMFKIVTFIELLKNIVKMTLVIYLAYHTVKEYIQSILLSSKVTIVEAAQMTGTVVASFFIKVAIVFIIVALIDMGVQRWNYLKRHKMSKDEVKREYKQDEGDPQIKGERRRLYREMVFGDARQNVKNADAVVSNPIHVAVAIMYDREEMGAPEILIKGQRRYAEMILQIAREENVPIIRNIPLAWSLLQVEEGDPIPEDLYEPVAEVLSLVYEMQEKEAAGIRGVDIVETPPETKDKPTTFDPLG
ncbi:type III secretion system export apparatus subunit SctU [bacterium]|nr:type III secretion system export apparatus subunit SctU [bacterium]MBU1917200.1 type III secretion system export apparatus subunit SctU [bacterium]